ncbi:WecB/TagA/CpsF family glycosyltransferase [Shewanella sp. 10N.7]|uniref:WecB/TagA/CpsF family glycosyltransferase n=1 Tax=Shewanella sp. 10N.7 TaxID=2885093 RepID=UPI001E34ED4C|nr:WecB/TagA/CpsF family glycosyltransferase [Shewanella sp. 10N.7]MCC4834784.1 WecB/TagA/CpsF family glycosyltransferase [Shewanella sp. 10N.7]
MKTTHLDKNQDNPPIAILIFDWVIALYMMIIVSPILVFKTLMLACSKQPVFETLYIHSDNKEVAIYRFSHGRFKSLPLFYSVLKGDIGLLGSAFEYAVFESTQDNSRPGMLSIEQMQRRMGIQHINSGSQASSGLIHYIINILKCLFSKLVVVSTQLNYPAQFNLLGVNIDNNTMSESVDLLIRSAQSTTTKQFAFVNADCLNLAATNKNYRNTINQCDQVFADGSGIRIACQLHHIGLKDNVNGTDMLPLLCEQAAKQGIKIFFLGGQNGTTDEAAVNLRKQFPTLEVVGCHHGYLNKANEQQVIEQINQSGAQILLVGMGAPKQDQWISDHKAELNTGVAIGVGGLFDFFANNVSRAPVALRQVGMEWIWRLGQEPTRMWKRYVIGNPLFLARVLKQKRSSNMPVHFANKSSANTSSANSNHSATSKQPQPMLSGLGQTNTQNKRRWYFFGIKCGQFAKRTFDIVAASILLIVLAPLFMFTALSIRIESKGAIFFSQVRSGRNNQPFTMWKFRSMYIDAEERLEKIKQNNEMQGGVLFKMKKDPRITTIGKLIRKASIDELPQLWNVLIGDMSLVGPRPALPNEVSQYQLSDRRRLGVKPGITCIWQVSGRSDIPFDKQVELDIDYIYKQSLREDISLLLKTIPAVLLARGAY